MATNPSAVDWTADIFGPTLVCFADGLLMVMHLNSSQDSLPGLESLDKSVYFINITYPRFLNIPDSVQSSGSDLLFELRVGRSGLGDDWLYTYAPNEGWKQIGRYLEVC